MIDFEKVDFDIIRKEYKKKYGAKSESDIKGVVYPTLDSTFFIKPSLSKLFAHLLMRGSSGERPDNVILKGPPGCGKTESAMQFAAICNLPLLKINCALIREPRDWFGSKTVESNSIFWVKSEFSKLIERGGAVILLDEISRSTPPCLNSLLPLLDNTGFTFLEEVKQVITLGNDIYFFATANIGNEFSGTYGKLDKALDDRFGIRIEVNYLPEEQEIVLLTKRTGIEKNIAKNLVRVANKIRNNSSAIFGGKFATSISTRNLLDAAILYKSIGIDSFEYTLIPLFSSAGGTNSDQVSIKQIIQSQFEL